MNVRDLLVYIVSRYLILYSSGDNFFTYFLIRLRVNTVVNQLYYQLTWRISRDMTVKFHHEIVKYYFIRKKKLE